MFFSERLPRSSKVAFNRPVNSFVDRARNHNAASRRFRFQAGGDVHAVSVKIITIDDQVAQVQAHTEHKRSICGLVAVGLGHGLLKLDSGAQRINCAGELEQGPVAGQLDQAPSVFRQNRIEVFGTVLAQARQRPALVTPHQAGVADNVCGQDRRQFALLTGQRNFPALLRRIVDGLRLRGNRAGRRLRSQRRGKAQGQRHHGYQASLRLQRSTADDGSLLTALERNYPRVPFQWLTYRS